MVFFKAKLLEDCRDVVATALGEQETQFTTLATRHADLARRVDEIESWLGEVGDDLINRTGGSDEAK